MGELRDGVGGLTPEDTDTLRQYCAALQDAAGRLRATCERLSQKASGIRPYTASERKADRADYESSVARYRELGNSVNALR